MCKLPLCKHHTLLLQNFFICWTCAKRVELFNKITHQKYLMYIECAKRVAEKRGLDPHKDTTFILNELLADENWLNQVIIFAFSYKVGGKGFVFLVIQRGSNVMGKCGQFGPQF